MRIRWTLFLLCLLCAMPAAPVLAATPVQANMDGWTLTFHDEFNGKTLDPTRWLVSHGPDNNSNNPVQFYTPAAVFVRGGLLHIRTEARAARGLPFTSGEIMTRGRFSQTYGRFETRCRFPRTPGVWSAVYLLPESGAWPPEIDITEWLGRSPDTIYLTNHWRGPDGHHHQTNRNYEDRTVDWTQWHTYRLEWGPGIVRWFIDGRLRGTTTEADGGPRSIASEPMYLRLNTAVGGRFAHAPAAAPWPQEFLVDWVRVYRRTAKGAAPGF